MKRHRVAVLLLLLSSAVLSAMCSGPADPQAPPIRRKRQSLGRSVDVHVGKLRNGEVGEGRDGRGLKTAALGNALLALGKLTLGQETVDRLSPVVQGIQQISHILPAVEFKDGRIVVATTSTSTTSTTTTTTTTTTTPEPTTTATTTTTTEASTKTAEAAPQSVQGNASPHRACTTPDRNQGRCQDLSSCPSLLLNLANLRQSICFQSIFTPGVCCPNSAPTNAIESLLHHLTSSTAATTTTSTTTTRRPTESAYRPGTSTTSTTTTTTTPSTARPAVPETNQGRGKCGQVLAPSFRVVGGDASRPGAWPWMAAIYLHGPNGVEFWCGGSLINERYVLTAAHCTQDGKKKRFTASQYSIRLGEYNLKAPDAGESEVFRVTEIKTHPSFSGVGFYNDVALFRMDHDARYTEYVQPVCLPSGGQRGQSFVGDTPTIIGWGTTRYGGRESPILRQVQLPVWRNDDCDRAYFQPITEVFLCAGYADGGKDACQGDSGGPLLLQRDNTWTQIGIVSFGNKCAEPGFPGVYTRLTYFLDWINSNSRVN